MDNYSLAKMLSSDRQLENANFHPLEAGSIYYTATYNFKWVKLPIYII